MAAPTRRLLASYGRWGWILVAAVAALAVSAVFPPIDLTGPLAIAAWAVSITGGKAGLPVLILLGVGWLAVAGEHEGRRRVASTIILLGIVGPLVVVALINEHVVKATLRVPRPNLLELEGLGVLESTASLYAIPTKKQRGEYLDRRMTAAGDKVPPLAPRVREHWLKQTGYSFPSGHSLISLAVATLLIGLGRYWQARPVLVVWLLLPWAILVGWSRRLLRVHSWADITCGGLAGIVIGLAIGSGLVWWFGRRVADGEPTEGH